MMDHSLAVFGDVHSNLEALRAVLADMDECEVSHRVCLGDIVGYAANPAKCLGLVREMGCQVVQGNHDAFAASEETLEEMNHVARSGIEFARRKLTAEQLQFLDALPLEISGDGCEFVHASLEEPAEWLYVMEESDARNHFRFQLQPICFCGHTHIPRVWHLSEDGEIASWRGEAQIELPADGKLLINAGAVGQPRDLCPDACYVIFKSHPRSVEFRRVPYEIRKTRRKILRAKLPHFAAQRLSLGR